MVVKGTKLDTNGFQVAIRKNVIDQQLGAPPPDPVCDAHGLRSCLARCQIAQCLATKCNYCFQQFIFVCF